ncbi:MAG: ASCH domain-containing protein [Alphaproteobacteria bacterium]|nr:ASCH domain-containing protein [Alphaproteobacteria bacterium]
MNTENVIHFVLKHKWFDKIIAGEKTSEYRECSDYWNKRLTNKHYDTVVFHKGYTNQIAKYKIFSIRITTKQNDLNLQKCWEIRFGGL